jgi:hypothetical protein
MTPLAFHAELIWETVGAVIGSQIPARPNAADNRRRVGGVENRTTALSRREGDFQKVES